ncbi:ribosome small subunit-dependent GTPase A [Zongyangia sp. HA2173]|uniref:ribosome small subunit-dependent GTPase A n=1 Tax=Zongyangia sp. HA2173 TaxID=3133035 RepID=UPI00316A09F4
MKNIQGLIVKALGGFYYVKTTQALFECRARGKFRKIEQTPLVGDEVEISPTEEGKGYVTRILPRRNFLVRPPLANIDRLILVTSIDEPAPNTLVLDKLIAIAEHKEIDPAVVITKADLQKDQAVAFADIYRGCGFDVFVVSNETGEGVDQVRAYLQGKLSAFCGNSGVGKSSLLNRIDERLQLETAHISQKLGRGRHTTRHVELYELPEGGYIADTPGFSSVDLERCEVILKDQLQYCFREFEEYIPQCKFTGCSHTCEKGCAVIQAVEEGKIPISRHENYRALYEDAKNIKEWELK